ncbi:MAG: SDR family oxidoreductase [Candidatus Aenigmarchaeota archaeon]|nr:SDR family oxidoreductase [Candidatus Aenigmarchaeota archaeon]
MKVLVTGSEGYVGTVLVRQLVEKGYDVTGLDTGYYGDCNIVDPNIEIPIIRKDVRDISSIDLQNVDAILHLAAMSNDPLSFFNPEITMDINFKASLNLAALAKKANIGKFIFASSCSSYGINNTGIVDENSKLNPITAYAQSKALAEHEILKLASNDFNIVLFRSATVNGLAPRLRFDLVVNNLTGLALTTGKISIKSDGTPWRPTVHVEDNCSAFLLALEAESIPSRLYNIGSTDENYQIKDIAEVIRDNVDCDVEFQNQDPDSRSYRVNCDKIKNDLNFKIKWPLEKSVKELVKNLTELGLNHSEFDSRKYNRLKQIKYLIETSRLDTNLRWLNNIPS